MFHNQFGCGIGIHCVCVNFNFGRFWCFIRAVNAREIFKLPRARFFIKAFHIALFSVSQRRVDEDFDELAVWHQIAHHQSFGLKRRDEGRKHNQPRIGHQLGHFAHTAHVFNAIGISKAQVAVQTVAHIVTV